MHDLVLIYRPHCFSHVNHVILLLTRANLHEKDRGLNQNKVTSSLASAVKGQVTECTTVKWSIPYHKKYTRNILNLHPKLSSDKLLNISNPK